MDLFIKKSNLCQCQYLKSSFQCMTSTYVLVDSNLSLKSKIIEHRLYAKYYRKQRSVNKSWSPSSLSVQSREVYTKTIKIGNGYKGGDSATKVLWQKCWETRPWRWLNTVKWRWQRRAFEGKSDSMAKGLKGWGEVQGDQLGNKNSWGERKWEQW